MSDRAREGLFSSLGGTVEEARVLDLFAGSGAIGMEALSRGAESALLVDSAPGAIKAINDGHLHYVITKPWKLQDMLQVVDQLVHTFRLERDNARLVGELRLANQQLRDHERVLVAQLESRGREISAATEQLAQMGIQLDALTLRDGLTGLYTHRAFQERATALLRGQHRLHIPYPVTAGGTRGWGAPPCVPGPSIP